jgi:hypothetical protein
VRDRTLVRWLVAACQCVSVLLTWPLWQVRRDASLPPNLPIFDSELLDRLQIPFGETLLLTLVMALVWPRVGSYCHAAVLVAAIVFDQMRIQPEFISLAILLVGTISHRGPLLIARGHLISLWFWAGLHKLLSPEYVQITGPDLVQGLLPHASTRVAALLGVVAALAELSLGLAAIFPRTRRGVPFAAALLHGIALVTLVSRGWNSAVWPWNLALAFAGYGFFANWDEPLWPGSTSGEVQILAASQDQPSISSTSSVRLWLCRVVLVVWMLYPALFYVNLCDGYLAWCVYASNVPEATVYDADVPEGERLFERAYESLNVPFSPAVRLFEQHFRRRGQPDDRLEIADPRPLSRWRGRSQRTWIYTSEGPAEIIR